MALPRVVAAPALAITEIVPGATQLVSSKCKTWECAPTSHTWVSTTTSIVISVPPGGAVGHFTYHGHGKSVHESRRLDVGLFDNDVWIGVGTGGDFHVGTALLHGPDIVVETDYGDQERRLPDGCWAPVTGTAAYSLSPGLHVIDVRARNVSNNGEVRIHGACLIAMIVAST
jgi:hypothetical protein